ncbi:ATP sulfurylase (sulfate adenylyltransferase) [Cenarchaeum symbiosum A]|uniref:Sulfate adenylyltransferase n=1 Tax=Cenarchaeum symbiosum (strain A) TaxID=414004 RepID=SAT_CENSY|nr:RecName: Full=Sulfate adenylyltransferase; AltName: Full=ATP-sulfurylase; AltName: Full=Sulfate adenylate transferase; Short=SAT [Cenarchaeum symbiosum A]ABK78513.1 ATP sulfurylase (sulfate adenylyltransferase) [Cenarchaeum symbiosum A]
MSEGNIEPHGGRLISRLYSGDASGMEKAAISQELASDVENIADGIFSPLEGFLGRNDFEAVLEKGRLADGTAWTIPIVFDADAAEAARIKAAGDVLLEDPSGSKVAVLHAEEEYPFDKKAAAARVYGTDDAAHPGVSRMLSMKERLVGGRIDLVDRPEKTEIRRLRMSPVETRHAFAESGWKTTVAFQTRNPPHVAHEMLQKTSITTRDGVFVNPIVGRKKPGDFADEVIVKCYEEMIKHYYPENRCRLGTLHTEMRYAGPREAIHHGIMRQNYGCTHIIIGRDHAGVGKYYDPFAAHRIFDDYPDLGITPIFFPAFFYCRKCLTYTNPKACPHGEGEREQISGTALRDLIRAGKAPSEYILRPEVARIILEHPRPFID